MHRIKDNYNWKKLRQWKFVLDEGGVRWRGNGEGHVDDDVLKKAVGLLANDCFPTAIICCCTGDGKKEILTTPLWADIFSFLDNKRRIGNVRFSEMGAKERDAVLGAHIFSIWIKEG